MRSAEALHTDLIPVEIGPFSPIVGVPIRLNLGIDGDRILEVGVDTGFCHKGIEQIFKKIPWSSGFVLADRVDPEAAASCELVLALALEELAKIEVSPRVNHIRAIFCELNRISSHLGNLARMAQSVHCHTVMNYMLRDREKALDLLELLTGSRFSFNYLTVGGVSEDVTDGFIERTLDFCEHTLSRIKEYNDIFTFNSIFLARSRSVGSIPVEWVSEFALSGPSARASGVASDVRKSEPYSSYGMLDLLVPCGERGGDCHDRYIVRLREIIESVKILEKLLSRIPSQQTGSGVAEYKPDLKIPQGEAFRTVESPRGRLSVHVVSDGGGFPVQVQWRTPSTQMVQVLPKILRGVRLEDLEVIFPSLDISTSEVDL